MRGGEARAAVEADLRRAFDELSDERVRYLVAVAGYVASRVLADRHLSRAEERRVERALDPDLDEAERAWVLSALQTVPEALVALPLRDWLEPLAERYLTLPQSYGSSDTRQLLVNELALRWPMLVDSSRAVSFDPNDIAWDERVLQIGSTYSMHSVTVRWRDVVSLEPVAPWPQVLLEWDARSAGVSRMRLAAGGDPVVFEDRVRELVDAARRHARSPEHVRDGWLAVPTVAWEPVERWPGEGVDEAAVGYRTAPARPVEILARRPSRGGLHVLLQWLASSPSRPFAKMVKEALLTPKHLYVRRRDGTEARLPRAALRTRRGEDDAIYVFGRRTEVLLGDRSGCPVCRRLDAQLVS